MKHIRKLLALTLAVVMALSVVLPASAATVTYGDARSITRVAAVDVLSSLGVIGGYANGTFRPTGSITRAEISKILAVMLNGGEDPGDQYADACTFADTKDHWAKGYIGYCVAQGLVGGRNPQTFDPEGKVTVVESAKMLLCALGYDAKYRGYSGSSWKTNVAADAVRTGPTTAGLLEGLTKLKNDDNINREDACQMMLNALQADMVYFPNIQTMSFDNVVYSQNDKPEAMPAATQGVDFDFMGRDLDEDGGLTAQLCEKLFPKLRLSTVGHDEIGAPATSWLNDGQELGIYNDAKPLITSDTAITGKNVRDRLPSDPLAVRFYQNGLLANEYSVDDLKADQGWNKSDADAISSAKGDTKASFYANLPTGSGSSSQITQSASILLEVWRKNTVSLRRIVKSSGSLSAGTSVCSTGIHSEIYYDEATRILTVTAQPFIPGEIVSIVPAVEDEAGHITRGGYVVVRLDATPSQWYEGTAVPFSGCEPLDLGEGYTVQSTGAGVVYVSMEAFSEADPADLVVGNFAAVSFSHAPTDEQANMFRVNYALVLQELTSTLTQKLSNSTGSTKYLSQSTFDGISYSRSSLSQGYTLYDQVEIGTAYTIRYLTFESTNVIFYYEDAVGNVETSFAYVRNAGPTTDSLSEHAGAARLLFGDGTEKVVYTATDQWDTAGYIVRFSINNRTGEYTLTPVGTPSDSAPYADPVTVTKGKSVMSFGGANVTANDETVFMIGVKNTTTDEVEFKSYTGIKNVPSVTAAKYYAYYVEKGVAKLIFLEDVTLGSDSTGIYGIMVKTAKDPVKTADFGSYYQVKAIVSGEVTTLNLTEDEYAALGNDEGIKIFKNLNYNADGLVSSHTPINGTQINTMTAPEKGIVTFNGNTSLSYHDNVLVYVYHAQSDTLEISEPEMLLPIGDPQYVDEYNTYPSFYTLNPDYDYDVLAAIYVCTD